MRSASPFCPPHSVSPALLWGRALDVRRLEEASTTLTDIKRSRAIAVFSRYLVYQEWCTASVRWRTLCRETPALPQNLLEDHRVCLPPMMDTGPADERRRELAPTGSATGTPYSRARHRDRAPGHLVPEST